MLLGNENLEIVNNYRYLGLDLNDTLDYSDTANVLSGAAGKALGSLLCKHFTSNGLPFDTFTKIYDATVAPIMNYGSSIWGSKSYPSCNKIYFRAMRSFLGVGKYSALPSIEGDMGWIPVEIRHHIEMLRLWFRLSTMPLDRITKRIFLWDYELSKVGKYTWSSCVKNIFEECSMEYFYENLELCDVGPTALKRVLRDAKKTLMRNHSRTW